MKHPESVYNAAEAVWIVADPNRPVDWLEPAVDAAIAQYNALGVNGLGAQLVLSQQRVKELEAKIATVEKAGWEAVRRMSESASEAGLAQGRLEVMGWNGGVQATIDKFREENEKLRAEAARWKANHDNQVAIKKAVMSRPDLRDRTARVQALIERAEKAEQKLADGWTHPEEMASLLNSYRTVLEGYEAWEASLLNDEAANLLDSMSKESYQTLMKLQHMRNLALNQ